MSNVSNTPEMVQVAYNKDKQILAVREGEDFICFHFPTHELKQQSKELFETGITYLKQKVAQRLVGIAKSFNVLIDDVLLPNEYTVIGRVLLHAAQKKLPVMVEFNVPQSNFTGTSMANGLVHLAWIGIYQKRLVMLETNDQSLETARQVIFTELKEIKPIY